MRGRANATAEGLLECGGRREGVGRNGRRLLRSEIGLRKSRSYCYGILIHPGFQWTVRSYRMGPSASVGAQMAVLGAQLASADAHIASAGAQIASAGAQMASGAVQTAVLAAQMAVLSAQGRRPRGSKYARAESLTSG